MKLAKKKKISCKKKKKKIFLEKTNFSKNQPLSCPQREWWSQGSSISMHYPKSLQFSLESPCHLPSLISSRPL